MSPERLYGKPYTKNCDVWSAGMTLFYAIRGGYPLNSALSFWEIVSELEDLVNKFNKDESIAEKERSFFVKCFSPVETRPTAEDLLNHSWLTDTEALTVKEKRVIEQFVEEDRKRKVVLNLTTHDTHEVALSLIKSRATEKRIKTVPTRTEIDELSEKLGIFSVTVEESFRIAMQKYTAELSSYELSSGEAEQFMKEKSTMRRRRRRTFHERRSGTLSAEISIQAMKEAKIESRMINSPRSPRIEDIDAMGDGINQLTKEINAMNQAMFSLGVDGDDGTRGESGGTSAEGEVKMISVSEARKNRRRRRVTFDGNIRELPTGDDGVSLTRIDPDSSATTVTLPKIDKKSETDTIEGAQVLLKQKDGKIKSAAADAAN